MSRSGLKYVPQSGHTIHTIHTHPHNPHHAPLLPQIRACCLAFSASLPGRRSNPVQIQPQIAEKKAISRLPAQTRGVCPGDELKRAVHRVVTPPFRSGRGCPRDEVICPSGLRNQFKVISARFPTPPFLQPLNTLLAPQAPTRHAVAGFTQLHSTPSGLEPADGGLSLDPIPANPLPPRQPIRPTSSIRQ
ncbi:unnamed protein product [Protopolystoma xenopodis]|uniref:Uncharacterized protein n=1 Tax=Protopolystoma xenopodis TaxID=117903 RepID=A0A3S5C1C1_9PLAT|nr:unnamed protein product [Protopolystoma xenopodis]